jgi:hypothetical protein
MFCRDRTCLIMAAGIYIALAGNASAHVKWFSPFNISAPPRHIQDAFNFDFVVLVGLSALLLLIGCVIEGHAIGRALLRGLDAVAVALDSDADTLIRAACGFFLVSLWALGGVILTPELKTTVPWIPWLQLAMAGCLLWRQTLFLTAAGFVTLYSIGAHSYGIFHLLDYPIFIGLAVYLTLSGWSRTFFGIRAIDILRWSIAITLMWASVEKWAYPQWSYQIIHTYPDMTLGFGRDFFMQSAGVIEFALSFALLLGPLVRKTASAILLGMFTSAIAPFGKIDAIGHAPIIAAVLAILIDKNKDGGLLTFTVFPALAFWRSFALLMLCYAAGLGAFIGAYYLLHQELYGASEALL